MLLRFVREREIWYFRFLEELKEEIKGESLNQKREDK